MSRNDVTGGVKGHGQRQWNHRWRHRWRHRHRSAQPTSTRRALRARGRYANRKDTSTARPPYERRSHRQLQQQQQQQRRQGPREQNGRMHQENVGHGSHKRQRPVQQEAAGYPNQPVALTVVGERDALAGGEREALAGGSTPFLLHPPTHHRAKRQLHRGRQQQLPPSTRRTAQRRTAQRRQM